MENKEFQDSSTEFEGEELHPTITDEESLVLSPTTLLTSTSSSPSDPTENAEIAMNPIRYGLGNYGSLPVSFQQYYLTNDILEYLQADPLFSDLLQGDQDRLTALGYNKSVDYPERSDHIYYEGYFHSLPTFQTYETVHPRYGVTHDKQPASLRLTSFYESLRRKNSGWTDKLKESLGTIPGDAAEIVIEILNENRHFAGSLVRSPVPFPPHPLSSLLCSDLAVQLHYGDEIGEDIARYHVDAINSLLHLGLSVHGDR
jgi:hypothetical protein